MVLPEIQLDASIFGIASNKQIYNSSAFSIFFVMPHFVNSPPTNRVVALMQTGCIIKCISCCNSFSFIPPIYHTVVGFSSWTKRRHWNLLDWSH